MRQMLVLLILAGMAPAQAADPTKDGLRTFKDYLEKNHKDKKWNTGPARLDSKEIQKAFPGVQFYYVFTSPPLPPGAPLPELLERHRQASENYRKHYISVTAAIDTAGVRPLSNQADSLSRGLMAVKNDEDARIAAAAILSVCPESGHSVPPRTMPADAIQVQKSEQGWTCSARQAFLSGSVTFDAEGKLKSVSRQSMLPLPPSAPPRPR